MKKLVGLLVLLSLVGCGKVTNPVSPVPPGAVADSSSVIYNDPGTGPLPPVMR